MNYQQLLNSIDGDTYRKLKAAVELGRWPDGRRLTREQQALTLQAVIVYESKHLPPEQRSGYVPPKPTPCETNRDDEAEQAVRWQEQPKE